MKRLLFLLLLFALASCSFAMPRTLTLPEGCTSWGKLPLTVAVDESAEAYRSDVNRGMEAWNDAMHQSAFVWAYVEQAEPDVIVAIGPMHRPSERGYQSAACARGHVLSTVVLEAGLDAGAISTYATHELGHALGLGHATSEQSIMHATIEADLMGAWDDDHPAKWYRILPGDARLAAALHAEHVASVTEVDAGPASGVGTSPSIDPGTDPGGTVTSVLNAAKGGQWRLLAGLLLSLLVWAARRWGASTIPWLKTDRGGATLVLALALLGGVAATLAGDQPFAWGLLLNSLSMAFTAAGGFAIVKKILAPSDAK